MQEDIDAVVDVLRSDYLTQGPRIREFEAEIAAYHRAEYAVAFANGTAALHAAYHSLGVGAGDEVISSPITFVASTNGAVYCGAEPRFADIDPKTNCIDTAKIEECVTERTRVITPVAYAGYPVDLATIRRIADRYSCDVLYDAAHAIGSRRDGTFGMEYVDAAILSFHPVKHIAAGEGGMVLTNRRDVRDKLISFRNHGITKDPDLLEKNDGPWYYEMQELGYNLRITELQCALGASQFRRIDDNLRRRNQIAKTYREELSGVGGLTLPPGLGDLAADAEDLSAVRDIHAYHLFTVMAADGEERKRLYQYCHDNGILVQIHYIPVHLQPYYRNSFGFGAGDFPEAEGFYARELSLPMYHGMSSAEQEYVIEKIKAFYK